MYKITLLNLTFVEIHVVGLECSRKLVYCRLNLCVCIIVLGLENVLIKLEEAYNSNQVDQIASKADFYAKCGQVAVEAARLRGGK